MGRYGMAGDHYRQSGYVTLQDVPDPNREYVESFANLTGGMNCFDLDYRLKGNESPFLQNLSWHNGTLTSRLGQKGMVLHPHRIISGEVLACSPFLYHGWMLVHIDTEYTQPGTHEHYDHFGLLYGIRILNEEGSHVQIPPGTTQDLAIIPSNTDTLPEDPASPAVDPLYNFPNAGLEPGTFLRYRDRVIYKTHGNLIIIDYDSNAEQLLVYGTREDEASYPERFIPTIQINSDPATGAGDQAQKENRICSWKKVTYNAATGVRDYYLPVDDVSEVRAVVDGVFAYTEFTNNSPLPADARNLRTKVRFQDAPPVTSPPTNNTVEIWYRKENADAMNSVMNSRCAAVFGGAQDLCLVVGGTDAQPNAYFWSGLGKGDAMDPTYFPMNQYNLAGDNDDPITAMGKQQNMLVIFQPHATGRAVFGTETINGYDQVTMNYTRINAEIGCDLPGSLQLVENNLVWCNRKYGVCRLKDSSAAYENNIVQISRKINGDYRLNGLLEQLKSVADDAVRSTDTGKRYILVLGDEDGKAYEWNYELSQYDNPLWFYHTGILGVGFVPLANEELYEVTADGKVATFESVFSDFGTTAIDKIYRFPPRDFGSYDRLKNIKSILVTTRSDSKTNTALRYICDYTERNDPTNLVVTPNERNFAVIFRRKPGYHNIHHLGIELSNNTAGDDLNIVSAQIFYEYRGRVR